MDVMIVIKKVRKTKYEGGKWEGARANMTSPSKERRNVKW
jgi:hypothetical protein